MIPELDDPVSQLFLSCDLRGSTDFKQRQPWQHVFLDFYRDFPQSVASAQHDRNTEHLKFDLWKPIGDELIYSCTVSNEDDVYQAVRTWIAAMQAYEADNLNETGMGTKGGAFTATFPGPDSKSSAPRDPNTETSGMDSITRNREAYSSKDHSKYLYDYFGPSIDTGFRLSALFLFVQTVRTGR